jgi:DNA polymerase (family 10)
MVKQALDNKGVSAVLQEVALFLELKGENPFKVKAYSNAARTIEILEEDLGAMVREGRLKEIKGIGETLAQHITELVATGRLLLAREPYAIDMMRIIDEASRSSVVIELNAHPYRLDIDWRLCKYAKEKGIKIAINPDAHEEEGLKDIFYGVGIGRKGWLEPGDILNAMDFGRLSSF